MLKQRSSNPELYFVRHGDYGYHGPDQPTLTDAGRAQIQSTSESLARLIDVKRSLLLSSTARRAMESSDIIEDNLGIRRINDEWLDQCGNKPDLVHLAGGPRELIHRLLQTRNVDPGSFTSIVAMAHEPLIMYVRGDNKDTQHGEIVPFDVDNTNWSHKRYIPPMYREGYQAETY